MKVNSKSATTDEAGQITVPTSSTSTGGNGNGTIGGGVDNTFVVTVTDKDGNSKDGTTNSLGKVTLPPTDRGYTNDNGIVKVNGYIVIVENTKNPISRAFVTNTEDGQITVLLPEPHILTADNQIIVTVLLN